MLYKNNSTYVLDKSLFENPASEYRGTPFWAWNCKITNEDIDLTLNTLKEMGMGGAHIHPRTGLALPYLSKEFMNAVKYSHEKLSQLQMLTWLYDEDRFPSGAAGGLVTKNIEFRQRCLMFSPSLLSCEDESRVMRKYLCKYAISLKDGCLEQYCYLDKDEAEPKGFDIWYLYCEIAGDNPWFNNQAYVDTLNPKAIDCFIKTTHEEYYGALGHEFGQKVPAIFTDEPQFCYKNTLGFASEKKCIALPFTDDFPKTYKNAYNKDFFKTFPECIWELPLGRISENRYYYHDHICERFTCAFADNIGAWCKKHGIALTGHMMEEPTLRSQTAALGEAMRSYRAFELPGIDMLYDGRELTTAKQAQSAVHQYSCEGMLSELYGVTNWDFDFRGHKLAGDWQAALGVTVRVHHLTWTSMAGEAKRDYPASIGYQSPWYKEYKYIENYFARLNTALTRGKPEVKIGVIHPIESYWLYWGAGEQTQEIRDEMEQSFKQITDWLLFGLIDFDFISQALWETQTSNEALESKEYVKVGAMKYDAIIVPSCITLRKSTLKRLKAFKENGGKVIFAGEVPTHVDAVPSGEALSFAKECEKIAFTKTQILKAVQSFRAIDIRTENGTQSDNLLYQMRTDNAGKWLFIAHCNKMPNPDLPKEEALKVKLFGEYRPTLYDALTGEIKKVSYKCENGITVFGAKVFDHDSLLYFLDEPTVKNFNVAAPVNYTKHNVPITLNDVDFELSEPNVLVLDIAESKLDDLAWQSEEEILRIDNNFRQALGYPFRAEAFAQPWINENKEEIEHSITLKFKINCTCKVKAPRLALENPDETKLTVNGKPVFAKAEGYYTDRCIQTVALPDLEIGENILVAHMPYYQSFNVEAMYLLGDFGVRVAGRQAQIIQMPQKIAFGDISSLGLPFYGGNITYKIPVNAACEGCFNIQATQFRNPLIKAEIDGKECGIIAFSPYLIETPCVDKGEHMIKLTAYGSRINTFGALHNCNHTVAWPGHPNSYRTQGDQWAYEYQLKPVGILKSPVITFENR